jgi:hypothetical protein
MARSASPDVAAEEARREVVRAALALLDGRIGVVRAARLIAGEAMRLDPARSDGAIAGFVSLAAQADEVVDGDGLRHLPEEMRDAAAREGAAFEAWAGDGTRRWAEEIVARYGGPPSAGGPEARGVAPALARQRDGMAARVPGFDADWTDPRNDLREADGSFSPCALWMRFGTFLRARFAALSAERRSEVGRFVAGALEEPEVALADAAATCFLRSLAAGGPLRDLLPYLPGAAGLAFRAMLEEEA